MQTGPFYQRIYDYLLEEISSGRLKGGDRAPTEKELCQQFGVSRITSKRALEMLAAGGYITRFRGKGSFIGNGGGKTAAMGGSGFIGLLMPSFRDFFGAAFVCETIKNCGDLGYHLLLKHTRDSVSEESETIHALAELTPAGILLMPVLGEYYNADILRLVLKKKPLVLVDRKLRGLELPSVSTDNMLAAETGTNYLLRLGHRKIAFYSGPISNVSTVEDRKQGFINALLKVGIVPDPALFCCGLFIWHYPFLDDTVIAENTAIVKDHLKSHPEISAAFAAEYPSAVLLQEAANQLGLAVPGDLSIVCFDAPRGISPLPPFTHLYQDEKTLAKIAVDTLHELITGKNSAPAGDILVPARFVEGASTAPLVLSSSN
ncbi:MAG: GntR family transcriptional regulator [Treponema sp.]|jgi:DNA-binding LacI/PurR family transcriptional regulator|nr:GntR family transcriptional regulator [Treponema sp.]